MQLIVFFINKPGCSQDLVGHKLGKMTYTILSTAVYY